MAATASLVPHLESSAHVHNIISTDHSIVKVINAEYSSSTVRSVPASPFTYAHDPKADSIPIIDYSDLTSDNPDRRSKTLQELAKACQEWGFFLLINHGIPETLLKAIKDSSLEFFELPDEEKRRYEAKSMSDPIKYGTGNVLNTSNQRIQQWRDFVKSYVHPHFYCPDKPQTLRDIVLEFSERTRALFRNLLEGIGENLGLEEGYMSEALKLESCFQMYEATMYPPCPQPDQAIGIPPHTDPGLLKFLIHNGVDGHQIQHNGKWVDTDCPKNSIMVNTTDHLEIFSNGRYKSVMHRAFVNNKTTRISVGMSNSAAPDAIVSPAGPLVERDGRALYRPMKCIEYFENKTSTNRVHGKDTLQYLKIQDE